MLPCTKYPASIVLWEIFPGMNMYRTDNSGECHKDAAEEFPIVFFTIRQVQYVY